MRLVKFQQRKEAGIYQDIHVNTDQVVTVAAQNEEWVRVTFNNGESISVVGSLPEIAKKLSDV